MYCFLSAMGERAKKKRAEEAKAARQAKKSAEQATQLVETPASADASSDNNLPTRSSARNSKKTGPAPRVPLSAAKKHKAQSVEGPSTDRTSSDNKLPTQFNAKNSKKTGAAAPRVASFASSRRSTRFLDASLTGSGKKHASAKGHDNESIATRPKRVATAAAKALLEQLKISETEDTDFEEDPQADGGSDDDLEIIELDDGDDGAIGGESGDDSDDSSGNGSEIEVVEDNLKMKRRLVAPAKVTRKGLPVVVPDTDEKESSSDKDEDGESTCRT